MKQTIAFTLNGEAVSCDVDVRQSLIEVLRDEFEMTGVKEGCSVGECGACTVIIDGQTMESCLYMAVWANGKNVTTIEGVAAEDGQLDNVQQAFVDAGAVQCGYCTPGMILSTEQLLADNPNPTRDEIRRGISGNMCRCTGYQKIVDAVELAAKNGGVKTDNRNKIPFHVEA
jgi:carbon-monoxide dehydrogenase small subunit